MSTPLLPLSLAEHRPLSPSPSVQMATSLVPRSQKSPLGGLTADTVQFSATEPPPSSKPTLAGKNLLAVDDESSILRILNVSIPIQKGGITTTDTAENMLAAFDTASPKPDLVVLDVTLYGRRRGPEMAQALLDRGYPPQRIVFFSSEFEGHDLHHYSETKPAPYPSSDRYIVVSGHEIPLFHKPPQSLMQALDDFALQIERAEQAPAPSPSTVDDSPAK